MAASPYQSLYRRYRSQRFSEVLGQDHVTRALRNAVRDGRVGHAYLFSGPRGTGKTSTARILAKALNCVSPSDGEPDCACESCLAVERGQVTDWLLEQDAASKSKVDDMRDLLDRVPLGTSGNRKVIILDEVHMLSQGAENALLKTLEEPPEHVVFVLATTDPGKVRPTIRSRTQQFEFHLLPPDVLADHVRHVIHDAGLSFADEGDVVAHVIRVGGGSARDTLSALDQVAALGEVFADTQPVDAIIEALASQDAGAALLAVADAMATGRDPRGLGEAIIGRLRDAFLAVMGAGDTHLPASERTRALELGERLGPSGLTRALDVLGDALTELSRKPDPRVVLEVALVRLTRPDADRSLDAVMARLERLESAVQAGGPPPAGGDSPPTAPPASGTGRRPSPDPSGPRSRSPSSPADRRAGGDGGPSGGGGPAGDSGRGPASAARAALAASKPAARGKAATTGGQGGARARPTTPPPDAGDSAATGVAIDFASLGEAWAATILPGLPTSVRSRWRGGRWVEPVADGVLRFALDNEWHQRACEEGRREVEQALAAHFGGPVRVELSAGGSSNGPTAPAATPGPTEPDDPGEIGDVAELADANDDPVGGVDLLMREFGGGELVEEDP